MGSYNALRIALYIIRRYMDQVVDISNLKLQKVLYFIQKGFLHRRENPCFNDRIEAWQYGPVVPSVYSIFSASGSSSIKLYSLLDDNFNDIENEDIQLLNEIIDRDLKTDVWEMVRRTHQVGGAWDIVFNQRKERLIPLDLIRNEA
jgi:hypothetical protein|nr:MAG TPA: hypothetical protein [Caudoviricetes sp.]